MIRWKVEERIRGTYISLGLYDSLEDALDCVIRIGKGTNKKFRIYKTEEILCYCFTAKQAEYELERMW